MQNTEGQRNWCEWRKSTNNYKVHIIGLEQVPTGVMRKQKNLCISGTNFMLMKTEYLQLFMGFENQKQNQKHVFPIFPETLKVKTLFPS